MLTFTELAEARRELQAFCRLHSPSILAQRSGISFKLLPDEGHLGTKKVRHLTTTATCISSLLACPPQFTSADSPPAIELAEQFAKKALDRKPREWKSEKSASVYCRCRALPIVINHAPAGSYGKIKNHITHIIKQLKYEPDRFGVGEADPTVKKRDRKQWYPPNAFHTYWAIEILDLLGARYPKNYQALSRTASLNSKSLRDGMLVWARQQLGQQIALHSSNPGSSMLDTDQLAWALAIHLTFDANFHADLERQDFIRQALRCLFSTQIKGVGTWRHYKPLFHYQEAGNAYCYVFETFSVLLQPALEERPEAEIIRHLLKPYCSELLDLWRYADSTKIPLKDGKLYGWCSGHRTNITQPESWATASVFSYAQGLRRLMGIWCREEALDALARPVSQRSPKKAAQDMAERGKTWGSQKEPVSEQLWTLFINPIRMHSCDDKLEPDSQPIDKHHARSAILYGPPGTSKTTLVRAIADVIGWNYVELHASHFVREGLAQVQKTADEIFRQLLELDHVVVLFDEIDELVRERDMEKDAFGRFLTTSMLPKLAELWDARKLLYFVATNHINYFDSAIIRSHRFDALVLVSPPAFAEKVKRIKQLLLDNYGKRIDRIAVTAEQVQKALDDVDREDKPTGHDALEEFRERPLDEKFALAKFALLRFDEIDELSHHIAQQLQGLERDVRTVTADVLKRALGQIADFEWRKTKSYLDFLRDTRSERRDYQMANVWRITGKRIAGLKGVVEANGAVWYQRAVDKTGEIEVPGFKFRFLGSGRVSIRRTRNRARG